MGRDHGIRPARATGSSARRVFGLFAAGGGPTAGMGIGHRESGPGAPDVLSPFPIPHSAFPPFKRPVQPLPAVSTSATRSSSVSGVKGFGRNDIVSSSTL